MTVATARRMPIRWADVDQLGHVNNAVVLIYLDEGRDAFLAERRIGREGYVVVRCEVDFRAEILLDHEEVAVGCEVLAVGRSSIRTREVITDRDGRVLVEAEVVIVLWDPEARGKREITDDERARLEPGADGRVVDR